MSGSQDRRAWPRFPMDQSVSVGPPGEAPVVGTLVNLSLSGAAIRIHHWDAPWLERLNQSDQLWLAGILDAPFLCRVVVTDKGMVRVHFEDDAGLRRRIQWVIDSRADCSTPHAE